MSKHVPHVYIREKNHTSGFKIEDNASLPSPVPSWWNLWNLMKQIFRAKMNYNVEYGDSEPLIR